MADWTALVRALERAQTPVTYSWSELEEIVGHLPPSASKHRAWWSGRRTHVDAWRSAAFTTANLVLGQEVTFVRTGQATPVDVSPTPRTTVPTSTEPSSADVVLIACVKEKQTSPAAARDLYRSPLFTRARSYAEGTGLPWFILSGEHGLVAPDEWLAPYERRLKDTPSAFREAWGEWVTERLELLVGSLAGKTVEVHAGESYLSVLRSPLQAKGADVTEPLVGLRMGERLAWYGNEPHVLTLRRPVEGTPPDVTDRLRRSLTDAGRSLSPAEFLAQGRVGWSSPGLYSWWVDAKGAEQLSRGLGDAVAPGLIYAGSAGATRWPSGRRSRNTLWGRLATMHLGGSQEFSTFRRTVAAILGEPGERLAEDELTAWMRDHLRVIPVPHDDADSLGEIETAILVMLDPPLNLKGMQATPVRARLRDLRRQPKQ